MRNTPYTMGIRKIPAPIKIKSAFPPSNPTPPQKNERILWTWRFSCRKKAFFPGVHKIGAAISGPRIADKNFTDTRIFLREMMRQLTRDTPERASHWEDPR